MQNKKESVALSSVFASVLLTLVKLVVGIITGSMGIISESAHSALDFLAAFITYIAVKNSNKPADATHHYGHGKIENISAFVETLLLIITSFWIIFEAVKRLMQNSIEVEVAWYSFAVMGLSIIIDFFRSKALYKTAKETNSQALEADALHFHSDIYSSSVVILGLVFYMLGVKGADSVAAIGVALFVLYAAYRLGRRTIDDLLDKAPEGMEEELKALITHVDGVAGIERIRVRNNGHYIYIEATIFVNRTISLENVNTISKNVQKEVLGQIKNTDVTVRVNPIAIEGESMIQRVQTIVSNHNLSAHNINIYKQKEILFVNFDLEVGSTLSLNEAHKKATHIEKSIIDEFGKNTNVNIHIEPIGSKASKSALVTADELKGIYKMVENAKKHFRSISDMHNIVVNKINGKYYVSLYCAYSGNKTIKEAHKKASDLEKEIKSFSKSIEQVNIHVEPTDS